MEIGEIVILNTNKLGQPDFKDNQNNEVNRIVEEDIHRSIDRKVNELIKGKPRIETGKVKDLSEKIGDFLVSYYAKFGIDEEKIVSPDLIYTGNTATDYGVLNIAIWDTVILADERSLSRFTENPKFAHACNLAHEQYHISSGQTVEVVVVQTRPSLEVKTNFVKSGLGMGESIYNSCLEEGMAVRMEEIVNAEVFGNMFGGRPVTEAYQTDDDYKWARKVIGELEENVPNFVRLAERARLLGEVDGLLTEIDKFYGEGIGDKLLITVASDSQFACEVLRKIKIGKTAGVETSGIWEKDFDEKMANIKMLKQKLE